MKAAVPMRVMQIHPVFSRIRDGMSLSRNGIGSTQKFVELICRSKIVGLRIWVVKWLSMEKDDQDR